MTDAIAPKLDVLQDRLALLRADLEAREGKAQRFSLKTQIQDVLHMQNKVREIARLHREAVQ